MKTTTPDAKRVKPKFPGRPSHYRLASQPNTYCGRLITSGLSITMDRNDPQMCRTCALCIRRERRS